MSIATGGWWRACSLPVRTRATRCLLRAWRVSASPTTPSSRLQSRRRERAALVSGPPPRPSRSASRDRAAAGRLTGAAGASRKDGPGARQRDQRRLSPPVVPQLHLPELHATLRQRSRSQGVGLPPGRRLRPLVQPVQREGERLRIDTVRARHVLLQLERCVASARRSAKDVGKSFALMKGICARRPI